MMSDYQYRKTAYYRAMALTLLLLAACSANEDKPLEVPEGAVAGDLSLEPCTHVLRGDTLKADCGTLVVPENRAVADSRLIALPVKRIYGSQSETQSPIFHLTGGPGGSNMNGVPDGVRDFVMVGYRGADGTVILQCPEVGQAFADAPGGLLSDESMANITAAYAGCGRRLQDEGVDLGGYTVSAAVDDMEAARRALGYERIHLMSGSYGTRVAMIYAWMYPESIHRAVLIGVNPPGHCVWQPDRTQAQLEHMARLYAQDRGLSVETVLAAMHRVAEDMPERWLFLPIDPDGVKAMSFMFLYNIDQAGMLFDAWMAAARGDASGLALMTLAGKFMFADAAIWGDNAAKVMSVDYTDYDPERDYRTEYMPPGTILGAPMSVMGWAARAGWPAHPIKAELRRVQSSDVEMLLINGNVDFASAVENARRELLPHLSRGHLVTVSESGHVADVWNRQTEATVHLVSTFYETGQVDDSRFEHKPVDFSVEWGLPLVAKLGLAALVLLVALLVGLGFLIRYLVRRIKRRRADAAERSAIHVQA
ncbi:MAG: alpha/beta fold hydrolase [Candidatus Latescibacteria bacterium]|nr:alpha/beta fold hydrolase [Candidatus Latescibacterota bacterium]